MEKEAKNITRRDLIASAALAGGALAVPAVAAGPDRLAYAAAPTEAPDALTAPAPISDISETIDAEILVLGAGTAGVCCALAAAEAGADVVVFQKSQAALTTGAGLCAYNVPEAMEKSGLSPIDFGEKLIELNNDNCGGSNLPLIKRFFENEVEAVEWFVAEAREIGIEPSAWIHPVMYDPIVFYGPTGGIDVIVKAMAEKAERLGARFFYSTPAVQLVTDDSGAVTGAVACGPDGTFIQANASKGVVLATGDYSNNPELVDLWCPACSGFTPYPMPERSGDGHLMAIWAGAQIAPYPHTKMVHTYPYENSHSAYTWLQVDLHGDRVFPEDLAYDWRCNAVRGHKENRTVQFFDANYARYLEEEGLQAIPDEEMAAYIEKGWVVQADTLEELIPLTRLDEENNALQTIARYNELAKLGEDVDFHKDAIHLKPIDTPPFYACDYEQVILSIPSGLQVNDRCAVISTEFEPIEGLYAIGNTQGGMFGGTDYPFAVNCGSIGRCVVFEYALGRQLAGVA